MFLANAFSLNMLKDLPVAIEVHERPLTAARDLAAAGMLTSAIGHADTAAILSGLLQAPVACNRANVSLTHGDKILVAQYSGPRLPEGTTTLPEGASFKFMLVTVG
jgi:hypothetical protein